jgi:hypothetical protein
MSEEDQEILTRNSLVESYLNVNDKLSALIIALENPPVSSKSEEVKVVFNFCPKF